VLVEGENVDGIFKVKNIGFPPPEKAKDSRSLFGHVNFFGGPKFAEDREALKKIEGNSADVMLVVLSDVWLDRAEVFSFSLFSLSFCFWFSSLIGCSLHRLC